MGAGASFALGPPGPRSYGRVGLLRFGATEAPAAMARGPLSIWDHRGPHRMGVGASFALGPPGPLPHGRGGLFRFWATGSPLHGRLCPTGPPTAWSWAGPEGCRG